LRGIHHGYRTVAGDLAPVLVDLDLGLRTGDRIALRRTNGPGKTTLMKPLTGLIAARRGTLTVDGLDTRSTSAARLSDHAAYLYQPPQQMFRKDTVRADVALFPTGRKVPGAAQRVDEVITRVGLDELATRDGRTLSGGQQRRATIAIGLAMRPTLLLLDEPTSSLAVRSRHDVTGVPDSGAGPGAVARPGAGAPSPAAGRSAPPSRSAGRCAPPCCCATSPPRACAPAPATTSPGCSTPSPSPCAAPWSPPATWSSWPPGPA